MLGKRDSKLLAESGIDCDLTDGPIIRTSLDEGGDGLSCYIPRDRGEMERIAQEHLRGSSVLEISSKLSLPIELVEKDLQYYRERELSPAKFVNLSAVKARELAKIEMIERAAWDGWERSRLKKRKTSASNVEHERTSKLLDKLGNPVSRKDSKTEKKVSEVDQAGDPRFLAIVERCIDRTCKILGIDAPLKVAQTDANGNPLPTFRIDWDRMPEDVLRAMVVEQRTTTAMIMAGPQTSKPMVELPDLDVSAGDGVDDDWAEDSGE